MAYLRHHVKDRGTALNTVAPLDLLPAQLAASDLDNDGQFKGQAVVTLTTLNAFLFGYLPDSFWESVNIYPDGTNS